MVLEIPKESEHMIACLSVAWLEYGELELFQNLFTCGFVGNTCIICKGNAYVSQGRLQHKHMEGLELC